MKKKYITSLLSLALLATGGGSAFAQTDVTSTYIVNPGFELSTGETGNIAGGDNTTSSKDYTETGWKNTNTATWSCSAVIAYGSGQINGGNAPASDNADATGNALGISVGWSGTVTYQSAQNITLPAGTYTLKVNAYNANTGKDDKNNPYVYFKSLFGFVTSNGKSFLSTKTSFTQSQWTEDVVTFTLDENTEGYIQLGGQAQNAGSGNNAKLLLDNITLTKIEPVIPDGTYYLYESSSKTFLSRGANWGTEATTDKYGIPVTTKLTDGKYTLSPADWNGTVYINGNADDGFYTDQGAYAFSAEKSGDGIILGDGTKYVTHVTGNLGQYFHKTTEKSEATVWTLMSVADRNALVNSYVNDNYTSVANASGMTDTGADQFLSSVSQNYTETTYGEIAPTSYVFTATADPRKSSASNGSPREVYQGEGHFDYTATGLAKGIYKVTIPALYRNGSNAWCVSKNADYAINSTAYITANGEQVRIKGWAEERVSDSNPNNVNEASAAFTSGKYANEVYCYVGEDGKLSISVNYPSYQGIGWGIFGTTTITQYIAKTSDAYTEALDKAKTTLASEEYANVTGEEKTNLSKVIEENSNVTSDYDKAIEALNAAVKTFTDAKASYDNYAANHEAADKIASALGVTPTAPTTAAEAASYFDNLNVTEYQEVSKTYNNDLTSKYDKAWTTNTFSTASGQHWSGVKSTSYTDRWNGSALTVSATKTITLPAGKWVIKAAGRSAASASISLSDGTTTVAFPAKGDTGYGIATDGTATFSADATYANNGNGRGWEWRFIPLTLAEQQEVTLTLTAELAGNSWAGFCDLAILADEETTNNLIASADDYKAMQEALTAAEQKTIGFDKDEYVPYNNVEALQALEAAKAINTEDKNSKDAIKALTEKLGQWTANTEAVSIVFNGNYATVEEGANYPKGWTRTNGWGQMQTNPVTAYYNQPGSLKYGDRTGYTMPLKASTLYKLTFKYASWEGNSNRWMTASVLNADNEGLAQKTFAGNGTQWNDENAFVTATAYFTTGAAGNYVLTLGNSGNTVITGVAITEEQSLTLDEEATTVPDALTAPVSVAYNRSFKQGWNSIVLPFATTPEELGADEAVTFTKTEGTTIFFNTVTTLEANKPYMVHFTEAKTGVTFSGKTVEPATELTTEDSGNQYNFVGSYVANNAPVAGDYIVVTKGIQKAAGGNHMKAFRAYFKAQGEESAAKAMAISIDGNDVTGIDAINFGDALQGNEPAYNLGGQRVGKSYKGIVIRNGKKTLNK